MLQRLRTRGFGIVLLAGCVCLAAGIGRPQASILQHQSWSTEAGLPQNSVHQILQTRDGYLWLATESGLVRYDGVSFHFFQAQNEPAFTSDDITSLAEDRQGTLWVGTAGGLLYVPRGTYSRWSELKGLPSTSILALAAADDGSLVALTAAGLVRVDAGKVVQAPGLAADVTGLEQRTGGGVLLLTPGTPILFQNGKISAFQVPPSLIQPGAALKGVQSGPNGQVWAWSDHSVLASSPGGRREWRTGQDLPGHRVTALLVDRSGTAWIGTNRGVVTVAAGSPQVQPVASLGANAILSLTQDAEGNIWVGTETSGLHALRPRKFHDEPVLADEEVSCLAQASDGTTWVGTRDDGVRRLRAGASGITLDTPAPSQALTSPVILSLAAGPRGDVWAGTPDGLSHIGADGKVTRYTSSDGLPDDLIRSLLVQPDGTLWAGTRRGLVRLQGTHLETFTGADGLGSNLIGPLFQDPTDHDLWVATLSGLSVLRRGRFSTYGPADGLNSKLISGVDWDTAGRLWVATRDAGLFLFEGGRFKPAAAGLVPRELFSVVADGHGFLWLRGLHGVVRSSASALAACASGSACDAPLASYGVEDGMPTAEMVTNGTPSAIRTAAGEIWFATRKGVAVADSQHLTLNTVPPPVVLERFLADNDDIPLGPTAPRIPSRHTRYTFDYAGLSYTAPAKVLYRFKLSGFDTASSQPASRRSASYTNLPPGFYTFQVQAANNDGLWNEAGTSFSFRILPPFYRRWWFLLGVLLLIAGVVVGLYRLRVRRLQRRFDVVLAERNRIAREIHDTLAQDFVGVSLQLDLVSQHIARNSIAEASQQLKATRDLVRSGLEEARQSIWNLRANVRHDSLPARITTMTRRFAGERLAVKIKIGGAYRDLPATLEDQVLRIAQEAVSNVSRHAEATSVRVQLLYGEDKLVMTVEDDGRGFSVHDAMAKSGHYGLKGIQERAQTLDAELDFSAESGKGTTMRLVVPLSTRRGHQDA